MARQVSWNAALDSIDPERRQRERQEPAYIFSNGRRFKQNPPNTGIFAPPEEDEEE